MESKEQHPDYTEDFTAENLLDFSYELRYTKEKRLCEIICIAIYCVLMITANAQLIIYGAEAANTSTVVVMLFGILTADFISGVLHWAVDSYGSIHIPIIGKTLIGPFREHHVDPTEISRSRDFVVTWGDSCITFIPVLAPIVLLLCFADTEYLKIWYNAFCFVIIVIGGVCASNQTHKWAHVHLRNPAWVKWMQKFHLLISQGDHHKHHIPPHTNYYCVVTGWMNYPLELINFWRHLEWVIDKMTGCKPRQDDMKWSKKKRIFLR